MNTTVDQTTSTLLTGAQRTSKSAAVAKLLTRARGATLAEMQEATGWQPHSVRAHLSGLRKRGRALSKQRRKGGETAYRFAAAPAVSTAGATDDA